MPGCQSARTQTPRFWLAPDKKAAVYTAAFFMYSFAASQARLNISWQRAYAASSNCSSLTASSAKARMPSASFSVAIASSLSV